MWVFHLCFLHTNVIIELDNNFKNNVAFTSSVNIMKITMTSENSVTFAEEIGPNLNIVSTLSTTDNTSNTGKYNKYIIG